MEYLIKYVMKREIKNIIIIKYLLKQEYKKIYNKKD